jgi:hypothetical protein
MTRPKEITRASLSGLAVFVLVLLRYCLMFFNVTCLVLLVLASITLIVFFIWITI